MEDQERRQDLELVERVLQGDEGAFRDLFDRHRRRVYGIAWRFTRNRDDTLEVTQEVFIKVHKALGSFDGRAKFTTWLSRIASNASIDWLRRRKGEHYEYRDDLANPETEEELSPVTLRTEDPLNSALRGEVLDKVRAAVDELSEKHRNVFILNTIEGMSYKEIAEAEEIPIGTVMSRLHYARKYLRDALRPYLEEGGSAAAATPEGEAE